MSVRDSQRSRVYNAESPLFYGEGARPYLLDSTRSALEFARRIVDFCAGDQWPLRLQPHWAAPRLEFTERMGASGRYTAMKDGRDQIRIRAGALNKVLLVHEYAHWAHRWLYPTIGLWRCVPSHGPQWASLYLILAYHLIGPGCYSSLVRRFDECGVGVHAEFLWMCGLTVSSALQEAEAAA